MKTTRTFDGQTDRYEFDFNGCTYANGWCQVDTKQDASYYGTWCNPVERKLFTYCEGDMTLVECSTDEDFVKAVRECADWNKKAGYWLGIDPGFDKGPFRAQFEALGLGDLLH